MTIQTSDYPKGTTKSPLSFQFDVHSIKVVIQADEEYECLAEELSEYYHYFKIKRMLYTPRTDILFQFSRIEKLDKDGSKSCYACVPDSPLDGGYLSWKKNQVMYEKELWKLIMTRVYETGTYVCTNIRDIKLLDQLMRFLLAVKLYDKKTAIFAHGAGVSKNGRGLFFPGWGHTGKTSLALHLVERGYKFLGDDFVLLGEDRKMLAFPTTTTIFDYDISLCPWLSRLQVNVNNIENPVRKVTPLANILESDQLVGETELTGVIMLNVWERDRISIEKENNLSKQICRISQNEASYLQAIDNLIRYTDSHINRDEFTNSAKSLAIIENCIRDLPCYSLYIPRSFPPFSEVIPYIEAEFAH